MLNPIFLPFLLLGLIAKVHSIIGGKMNLDLYGLSPIFIFNNEKICYAGDYN